MAPYCGIGARPHSTAVGEGREYVSLCVLALSEMLQGVFPYLIVHGLFTCAVGAKLRSVLSNQLKCAFLCRITSRGTFIFKDLRISRESSFSLILYKDGWQEKPKRLGRPPVVGCSIYHKYLLLLLCPLRKFWEDKVLLLIMHNLKKRNVKNNV